MQEFYQNAVKINEIKAEDRFLANINHLVLQISEEPSDLLGCEYDTTVILFDVWCYFSFIDNFKKRH